MGVGYSPEVGVWHCSAEDNWCDCYAIAFLDLWCHKILNSLVLFYLISSSLSIHIYFGCLWFRSLILRSLLEEIYLWPKIGETSSSIDESDFYGVQLGDLTSTPSCWTKWMMSLGESISSH